MVTQEHIDAALDRLVRLGPMGTVRTPEELCALVGVDHDALIHASSISATSTLEIMMNEAESNGLSAYEVAHHFATEHMLGFLMGVIAQHMASEPT